MSGWSCDFMCLGGRVILYVWVAGSDFVCLDLWLDGFMCLSG